MTLGALLLFGLGIGLLGSTHCVAMCGGLAGALSMARPGERADRFAPIARQLCLGAGRVLSYSVAGLLAGSLGVVIAESLGAPGGLVLRALAALLLVLLGLYLTGAWHGVLLLERTGAQVWRRIAPLAARLRPAGSLAAAFGLGILWGWLPCGLVYSALALAATAGDPMRGAALMAAFGLGTLPATIATGLLTHRFTWLIRRPASRRLAGVMLILFGLWTFAGAATMTGTYRGAENPCHSPTTPP